LSNGRHFGLGFGLVLFTQESGRLGSVLRLMQQRDPTAFRDVFGPSADELLAVTNAATPEARLGPVGGQLLWTTDWTERFRRAGDIPACQYAQNQEAIEGQFRPMLPIAFALGLDTDRALAMVYDRVVTRGLGGGLREVVHGVGVLRTGPQRRFGLRLIGFNDIASFQADEGWTGQDGRFGPATHAALMGRLRARGELPLPDTAEMLLRLGRGATGAGKRRLTRLYESDRFGDVAYRMD